LSWLCLAPDTSPSLIYNPKALRDGFRLEQCENARHDREHCISVLTRQSENNDPVVVLRRVGSDVGEIQVEGDRNALLVLTDFGDGRVGSSAQMLVEHRVRIVAVTAKQGSQIGGEVLIEFEPHAAAPSGVVTTRSRASSAA
jgi:tRNA pseudouridine-54 N-methylase